MKLHISESLSFPLEFVTQTQAILAMKRVGKSYTASVQAEELLKAGQQIVAIDITGAWHGLRSNATGDGPGFPILIAGGDHGDIPLEESAGELLAEAIVSERFSAILDLSLFRKAQAHRFLAVFLETLYRKNREAMHLFADEADFYAPQKPFGEEARTLGAMNDIVRRGGIRGIGCTLITQRPAVLSKDVLTQCGILTTLRISHPRDMAAIKEWVDVHSTREQADEMMRSLPSLPKGTAWVWSPGWPTEEGFFQRIKVRQRETFDSGATPKAGQVAKAPKVIAKVDIQKLGQQITATAQRVKENDPKELKRRIAELERQVAKPAAKVETEHVDRDKLHAEVLAEVQRIIDTVVQPAVDKKVADNLTTVAERLERAAEAATILRQNIATIRDPKAWKINFLSEQAKIGVGRAIVPGPAPQARAIVREAHTPTPLRRPTTTTTTPSDRTAAKLRAGAERMLAALVQWSPSGMREGQMRAHAGMKKSGTFTTYMSDLRTGGYIDERDGVLCATQAGLDYFGGNVPAAPQSTEEVLAIWEPKLRDGARRILRVLVERRGKPVVLDDLSVEAGMTRSGTFTTYLSDLRTARLIVTEHGQAAANRETLFL